jgi:hypothetical protein
MIGQDLRPLVGDLRQVASVRRIALDDAAGRDARALPFPPGAGRDFGVMAARPFDGGPLWSSGIPIAWQSPAGFRAPDLVDLEADGGRGFNRAFSGFLATCGLDHVRQPRNGHPLHGRFPFTPGRLLAYGEDWDQATPVLFCEGEMVQARYGGEALRLRRRIEAPVGGRTIHIVDTVENLNAQPWEHEILYHFNLGFPALATGTQVMLGDRRLLGPITLPDAADISQSASYPVDDVSSAACTVITPVPGNDPFELAIAFSTDSLPHLQIWRDLRPHAGVLSIEPCTSAKTPEGFSEAVRKLGPGESVTYRLHLSLKGAPSIGS